MPLAPKAERVPAQRTAALPAPPPPPSSPKKVVFEEEREGVGRLGRKCVDLRDGEGGRGGRAFVVSHPQERRSVDVDVVSAEEYKPAYSVSRRSVSTKRESGRRRRRSHSRGGSGSGSGSRSRLVSGGGSGEKEEVYIERERVKERRPQRVSMDGGSRVVYVPSPPLVGDREWDGRRSGSVVGESVGRRSGSVVREREGTRSVSGTGKLVERRREKEYWR